MTADTDAIAGLAEDMGRALLLFAERLRSAPEAAPTGPATPHAGLGLGRTQQSVLDALSKAPDGLTSAEVAKQIGKQPTNTPRMLKALAERGRVVGSEEKPTVWRVVPVDQ